MTDGKIDGGNEKPLKVGQVLTVMWVIGFVCYTVLNWPEVWQPCP